MMMISRSKALYTKVTCRFSARSSASLTDWPIEPMETGYDRAGNFEDFVYLPINTLKDGGTPQVAMITVNTSTIAFLMVL